MLFETHFIFMLFETNFVFMLFALMLFGNSPVHRLALFTLFQLRVISFPSLNLLHIRKTDGDKKEEFPYKCLRLRL